MSDRDPSHDDLLRRTASLIREYQAGDDDAFERLYQLHHERVLRSVAHGLGRHLRELVDPQDVLQETFQIACAELKQRSFEDFRTIGRFRFMLAKIARQLVIDTGRFAGADKRDWRRTVPLQDEHAVMPSEDPRPSQGLHAEETEAVVEAAMLSLSDTDRQVLDLRQNLEMDYRDIAEVMELNSAQVAKLRYSRANRRLQAAVRDELGRSE